MPPNPSFLPVAREIVGGVCWSGMQETASEREAIAASVAQRKASQAADRQAFRASPRGRFVTQAELIYAATGDCRLLDCNRPGEGLDAARAERFLATMEGPAADAARETLAEHVAGVGAAERRAA